MRTRRCIAGSDSLARGDGAGRLMLRDEVCSVCHVSLSRRRAQQPLRPEGLSVNLPVKDDAPSLWRLKGPNRKTI
jgi:hypothetical protein